MNKYQYAFIQELKPTQYTQTYEGAQFLIHSVILPYIYKLYRNDWLHIEWIKDNNIDKYNDILGFVSAYIKSEEKKLIHKFITKSITFPNVEYEFSYKHATVYITSLVDTRTLVDWLAFDLYAIAQSMEIFI